MKPGMPIKYFMRKVILIHGVMHVYWVSLIHYNFIKMVYLRCKSLLPMVAEGQVMSFSPVHILSMVKVGHYSCYQSNVITLLFLTVLL